ncbi:hypothetical protein UPYG_G00066430 [Umbra pygmaea]|uniref:PDZ domain-containing protein n=1 Tax=Umbra pygmaea TaxID=75934 RepID=A0ABD0XAI5_UMBPY
MEHKLGRRRTGSLSEGLMLEELQEGGLVVSSVIGDTSTSQRLKKGDELVGATINFDTLSKKDVLKILKLMDDNGYDDKVQVLTKSNLNRSMVNLDSIKAPNEMLNDSYKRLYNSKIKRFMKDDSPGQHASNEQGKSKGPRALKSKAKVKGDLQFPVHSTDFPVVETHKTDMSIRLRTKLTSKDMVLT